MPYGGHAPGHVRETFCEAVEAFQQGLWHGGPQPVVEFEIRYEPHTISLSAACGLVWNCTDTLPSGCFEMLADLDIKRRTYAAAARAMRKYLAEAAN
jgi:hypothetical protein